MKDATFAPLSALLLVACVGSGCGGTTRAGGRSDAGTPAAVDSGSAVADSGSAVVDSGSALDADGTAFALDGGIDEDGATCVLFDGGHSTCGGPWRCCREGTLHVEVVCVAPDAACPGPPP